MGSEPTYLYDELNNTFSRKDKPKNHALEPLSIEFRKRELTEEQKDIIARFKDRGLTPEKEMSILIDGRLILQPLIDGSADVKIGYVNSDGSITYGSEPCTPDSLRVFYPKRVIKDLLTASPYLNDFQKDGRVKFLEKD